jgi:hypothetical protein
MNKCLYSSTEIPVVTGAASVLMGTSVLSQKLESILHLCQHLKVQGDSE